LRYRKINGKNNNYFCKPPDWKEGVIILFSSKIIECHGYPISLQKGFIYFVEKGGHIFSAVEDDKIHNIHRTQYFSKRFCVEINQNQKELDADKNEQSLTLGKIMGNFFPQNGWNFIMIFPSNIIQDLCSMLVLTVYCLISLHYTFFIKLFILIKLYFRQVYRPYAFTILVREYPKNIFLDNPKSGNPKRTLLSFSGFLLYFSGNFYYSPNLRKKNPIFSTIFPSL